MLHHLASLRKRVLGVHFGCYLLCADTLLEKVLCREASGRAMQDKGCLCPSHLDTLISRVTQPEVIVLARLQVLWDQNLMQVEAFFKKKNTQLQI